MSKTEEDKRTKDEDDWQYLSPVNLASIEDDWEPRGLCGLINMGNTCYMNAAIQSLSNCTPLTQYFLKCDSFVKACENGKNVSADYCKLMKLIWGSKRQKYITPIALSRSVRSVYAQFRGFAQQDSQEFLRCLMDRLHWELKRPIMNFSLQQNRMKSKRNFIKHESKKLLGGNGASSEVDQFIKVDNESESDFIKGGHAQSEKRYTNEKTSLLYHSIITDVFNGKLKSSVQCLACNRVSTTIENFQDLSLPIPGKDDLYRIHSQCSPHSVSHSSDFYGKRLLKNVFDWTGSWFVGPQVSLQDCLAAFFAKDELKGDNMYNCEKCNKLRNGVKFLKVLSLPEVLSIHLKRFRHDMYYSSKISSCVSFPVNNLNFGAFIDNDCDSKSTIYDLCAVITHFGNVGGGHYVAYAKNCINNKWYEFNDSMVSEVSEHHVENAEAYVLFYNKRSSTEQFFRACIREELKKSSDLSAFHGVYISKEWLTRFETCVEPGHISNCDFLCKHGNVPPAAMHKIEKFVSFIPVDAWSSLHSRFGGGPEVNMLNECKVCKELQQRREYEQKTFTKLHEEFQKIPDPEFSYCLSISWYNKWNAFTREDELEPPGAIDNSSIMEMRGNTPVLREDSSYGWTSLEAWQFLHSIYGGGPEYKIVRKSSMETTDNESNEERDLTS